MITPWQHLDYMIMNSDEVADKLISYFITAYEDGLNINSKEVQDSIFKDAGITSWDDLIEYDRDRVLRKVERYVRFGY